MAILDIASNYFICSLVGNHVMSTWLEVCVYKDLRLSILNAT